MRESSEDGGWTVLLAEDDAEMRSLLSLALRKKSWNVTECKDGKDLLAQLGPLLNGKDGATCDLIITDIRMPSLSGLQIVEGLVSHPRCPPVVLITAFGDDEIHERARLLGVAAVLDKPFEIDEFVEVVGNVLERGDTTKRRR